jgi:hypothetical protein
VVDGEVADTAGNTLTGWTEEIVLRELTPSLFSPQNQSNSGRNKLNANGYIEVEIPDLFGVGT